ncbi:hypothetical protein SBA_ch1_30560 [Sphingomonas bisphenolicum]|uniref:Uncharacterized protein n=1 Tax=Sphingomonas bisphenolicum TaxID=296544 RepID=A0ABN5WEU5_9SPHN|nr:hypothetical protein SBA_ch1_30560 [Sphingomonas bisphenolicum]
MRHLEGLHSTEDLIVDDGIALLELGRNAHKMFNKQSPGTQNALLKLLVSNTVWAGGMLRVEFNEPFGMLDKMSDFALRENQPEEAEKSQRTIWLPE